MSDNESSVVRASAVIAMRKSTPPITAHRGGCRNVIVRKPYVSGVSSIAPGPLGESCF